MYKLCTNYITYIINVQIVYRSRYKNRASEKYKSIANTI